MKNEVKHTLERTLLSHSSCLGLGSQTMRSSFLSIDCQDTTSNDTTLGL